jgi:hypothetical protein
MRKGWLRIMRMSSIKILDEIRLLRIIGQASMKMLV